MHGDILPEEPSDLDSEPIESDDRSDLDYADMPCTDDGSGDGDESKWEAFLPEEAEWEPGPDPGDFWIENEGADQETTKLEKNEEGVFG